MLPVELHEEADAELDEAALHLEAERAHYGDLFVASVYSEFDLIATYPLIGRVVSRRARSLTMSGFRYSIIYQAKRDYVFIVAIAHHSRRPNYWRPRLR